MMFYVSVVYQIHIRIRDEEGQQQRPFNLKDTDGVLKMLGLFKVALMCK